MGLTHPFKRTARPFTKGRGYGCIQCGYVDHPEFAIDPKHYIRAFRIIQKDMIELFDYVEPADKNLPCYSYRIHELLLRASVEVEANCKAILVENGYVKANGELNFGDYRKLEKTHHLSSFEIVLPTWHGAGNRLRPFAGWASGTSLGWHQAYNESKHNRHHGFESATFGNMINAVAALLIVLSAQFWNRDFEAIDYVTAGSPNDGTDDGIGGYFRVIFPRDWDEADMYDFSWPNIAQEMHPIQTLSF